MFSCAPAGDNHEEFYGASSSPSWHIVATEFGHMDFLEPAALSACGFTCSVCTAGTGDSAALRSLTGGQRSTIIRGALQDEAAAWDVLDGLASGDVTIELESR